MICVPETSPIQLLRNLVRKGRPNRQCRKPAAQPDPPAGVQLWGPSGHVPANACSDQRGVHVYLCS
ncbi:hypothetical protein P7K49_038026 [Saguinus oedipus]|uniref:Uncharacterized protein n=1 Tax=Saguinus oedipus TaxID=9490 RepID=A0ABQ9TDH7_SAGOE|nr:hypothetical protein P7K49_038026 [Saguinus oedipus]